MPLKITKASDPIQINQIAVCVYGPPGVGKSSLGFTADAPLTLDFDRGCHRSAFRKDVVQIGSWQDVASMTADDLSAHKTVNVDTAGRALDFLSADIIARDPKKGYGGALTLQGFGELKARFTAWMKLVRSFGKDIVLISHMDEQKRGDDLIERLDMQGASKNEIYKVSDLMGRLAFVGQKRVLNFNPTDTAFGKNPAGFPVMTVPNFNTDPLYLAEIIQKTKDALNHQGAEQIEAAKALNDWFLRCTECTVIDEFNKLAPNVKELPPAVAKTGWELMRNLAKTRGWVFDSEAKLFKGAA